MNGLGQVVIGAKTAVFRQFLDSLFDHHLVVISDHRAWIFGVVGSPRWNPVCPLYGNRLADFAFVPDEIPSDLHGVSHRLVAGLETK